MTKKEISEALQDLEEKGLIECSGFDEEGEPIFKLTQEGKWLAESLKKEEN